MSAAARPHAGRLCWTPPPDVRRRSRVGHYLGWLVEHRGLDFAGYRDVWRWSVEDLEGFWGSVWDYFEVERGAAARPYDRVLADATMPGARWFTGATVNYAEQLLRDLSPDEPVLLGRSQTRAPVDLTGAELVDAVRRVRAGLRRLGVGQGDRVAAYLPHVPEAVVLLLATASLGAVFTSCAPEFGRRSVVDRWLQVGPRVLVGVDGYRHGGKEVDRLDELRAIRRALPEVEHLVLLPYLRSGADLDDAVSWSELTAADPEPLEFAPVPFDHPLYVLYSSGTTGLPKPIVHGHGGILLEHLKVLALHLDLGPGDRFFWHTTTGWMMWNLLVSGLAVGAAVVCFDGSPSVPDLGALWRLAEACGVTYFGTSAPYLLACRKAGVSPRSIADTSRIRGVGSTGSPLPAEGFTYVYEEVGSDLLLQSFSGGTDLCTGFVGGSPLLPVRAGTLACPCLGAAVAAYDPAGRRVENQLGELVLERPMPSMPVSFWGDDAARSRYRAAYFSTFPGVWRHGDWITVAADGSCVITGRSDATLNRGGVRIGTAEVYAVVEELAEVADSLVVHLDDERAARPARTGDGAGGSQDADAAGRAARVRPGELLLFVVPAPGVRCDDAVRRRIADALRTQLSPRHVPDRIVAVPAVPRTLSGKKLEVPVKQILQGRPVADAVSTGAVADADVLAAFAALAAAGQQSRSDQQGRPDQ